MNNLKGTLNLFTTIIDSFFSKERSDIELESFESKIQNELKKISQLKKIQQSTNSYLRVIDIDFNYWLDVANRTYLINKVSDYLAEKISSYVQKQQPKNSDLNT